MSSENIKTSINVNRLRISKCAQALIPRLKEVSFVHFAEWFFKESSQTIVGSATFTEYFRYLDKLKKNGDKS
jgi:hypothetical protein